MMFTWVHLARKDLEGEWTVYWRIVPALMLSVPFGTSLINGLFGFGATGKTLPFSFRRATFGVVACASSFWFGWNPDSILPFFAWGPHRLLGLCCRHIDILGHSSSTPLLSRALLAMA